MRDGGDGAGRAWVEDEDEMSGMHAGAASAPLATWLAEALGDPGPYTLQPLRGGNSNETFLLHSPRGERILRRPPASALAPTAHDLAREYRILTALATADVPTPRPLAFSSRVDVAPTPLLVMEYVDGVALTDALPDSYPPVSQSARAIGEAAVDALAALHRIDWRGVGLDGFGSPEGFLERQVRRWRGQYERYELRRLPVFEAIAAWLEENRPPASRPGIMHGDFHLDNCLLSANPPIRVMAIIDWEMATVGDPLLDLGLFLAFWGTARAERPGMPAVQAVSRVDAAPTRLELAQRYAAASGRDVQCLDYYLALAFWKLAAIVEGAYARFVAHEVDSPYARALRDDVPALLDEAAGFAGIRRR